jgi:hypothetical protein
MRTISLLLAVGAFGWADEVTLKGGGKFSGIVEEKGDKVIIRMEHGTEKVDRIDRSKSSVLQEYEERVKTVNLSKVDEVESLLAWVEQRRMPEAAKELRDRAGRLRWDGLDTTDPAALEDFAFWARTHGLPNLEAVALQALLACRRKKIEPKDPEALYQLGLWAKGRGLAADALVLFQETISLRPDHEFARRALGFQFFQGKWMTPSEVKVAMGLIEFEGDWMTTQAKEAIRTARAREKERRVLEEVRKKLEDEGAKAGAEYAAQRAALDARLAEITAKVAELDRRRADFGSWPGVAGCPLGVPGCAIVTVHSHCSRAGCTLTTMHFHCSKPGCSLLTYHVHP